MTTDHDRGTGPPSDLVHAGGVPLPPLPGLQPVLHCQQAGRVQEQVHVRLGGQVPRRQQLLSKRSQKCQCLANSLFLLNHTTNRWPKNILE